MDSDGVSGVPALHGIRVLDISTLFAAPTAAAYLGEFGADVIKVEQPGIGDHQRAFGTHKDGRALMWASISRNKRSVTIDLRKPEGAQVFRRLAAKADVVIENFRPGTLERWGIGPDVLHADNPGLVILRVTGYGQTGPYAARPGFGTLAEAMSGFSHLVGEPDGPPTLPSFPLADGIAGLNGAFAVVVALHARRLNGGRGQVIDLSLFEPILRLLEPFVLDYDQVGTAGRRLGNRSDHVAPRNAYRCADGRWVALSASSQSIFERLTDAIDRPDLAKDPRYANNNRRIQNAESLDKEIGRWFAQHTSAEVIRIMDQAAVAVGLVYDIPMLFDDPHVAHRKSLVQVTDPHFGTMRVCNVVPRLSLTPGSIRTAGPDLGEHTDEVLTEVGLTSAEIDELRKVGAI